MSDQFPVSSKTPMMTAPAILEWLEGEIEDLNMVKATRKSPLERGVYAAIASHLEDMSRRFAETTLRGMDGDETAARRVPRSH